MRAVIYTRTGSSGNDDSGRQLERCRTLAAERGWEVVAAYADQGSAWNMDRPGLSAAMDLVRGRGCDILIAYALFTLTRRASDLESILADADAAGVTVHLVTESLDSWDAASRLALRITASL